MAPSAAVLASPSRGPRWCRSLPAPHRCGGLHAVRRSRRWRPASCSRATTGPTSGSNAEALAWTGNVNGNTDVLTALVRLHDPRNFGELRLGRQILTVGAMRPIHVDGADARDVRAPTGTSLEAFGGVPLCSRSSATGPGTGRRATRLGQSFWSEFTELRSLVPAAACRRGALVRRGWLRLRVGPGALVRAPVGAWQRSGRLRDFRRGGRLRAGRPLRGSAPSRSTRPSALPRASSLRRHYVSSARRRAVAGRRHHGEMEDVPAAGRAADRGPASNTGGDAGLDGTLRAQRCGSTTAAMARLSVEGRRQGSGTDLWSERARWRSVFL